MDFIPGPNIVKMMIMWIRLPGLPMEFWSSKRIWGMAREAGKQIETDSFTNQLQKTRFARVKVEIDSMAPQKPGVPRGRASCFGNPLFAKAS